LEQSGFDQEKQFIKQFVGSLDVGPLTNRISMTEFGTNAVQQWNFLNATQNQASIQAEIDKLTWWNSNTCITCSLETTTKIFADPTQQRPNGANCIPQVAVLVTDGRNNVGTTKPVVPANQLKAMGVNLFAVGVGPDASRTQLDQMTGDPSRVYMVGFDDMNKIISEIVAAVCAAKPAPCPNGIPPAGTVPPDYDEDTTTRRSTTPRSTTTRKPTTTTRRTTTRKRNGK